MEIYFIIFLVSFAYCGKIEDSKDQQWENFKLKFDKQYKNLDHEFERKSIFLSTLESIEKHNIKYEQGISTYYQGVNSFSDWTWDEFKLQYLNSNMDNMNKSEANFPGPAKKARTNYPDHLDYRNIMNPVQSQGCGDCWAFAGVGAVEAAWVFAGHSQEKLSEQFQIDCGCCGGCGGGQAKNVIDLVVERGSPRQADYPYLGHNDDCYYDASMESGVTVSSKGEEGCWWPDCGSLSVDGLVEKLNIHGPLANLVHVNDAWGRYAGGIFDDESCPTEGNGAGGSNHNTIHVGYDLTENYWIIRNSWGPGWGEDGYIRMKTGKNLCSIETYVTWANI